MNLAPFIDHTNLAPDANAEDIARLCTEAYKYGFASVCVNPLWVRDAAERLSSSDVAVCAVVGFPTGAHTPKVKRYEAEQALKDGARELDMVIDIAALKRADRSGIEDDIEPLATMAQENKALLKVILEVALLTDEEVVRGCRWAQEFGADFVKTSTGTLKGDRSGATVHAVKLMRAHIDPTMGLKAAGGIRDRKTAEAMIEAGATRIGTSSSLLIVETEKSFCR